MSDSPDNRPGFDHQKQTRYERLFDLLADQALFGLEPTEQFELEQLLEEFPEIRADELEATTAAIHAAHLAAEQAHNEADLSDLDKLPHHLQAKIAACLEGTDADDVDARAAGSASFTRTDTVRSTFSMDAMKSNHGPSDSDSSTVAGRGRQRGGERMRETLAWLCAAAALLIALFAWLDRGQLDDAITQAPPLTPAEKMNRLIESGDEVRKVAWTVNDSAWIAKNQQSVKGNVVWSDEKQEGYMTFQGLAPNQPSATCYQLWIFDKAQDDKYPISGGVFYIESSDEETVVPIDPELFVQEAYLFAITVEEPPGVVVSDRSRLPLLASVE